MYKFAIAALLSSSSAIRLHQKVEDPLEAVDNSLAKTTDAASDLFNQIGVAEGDLLCADDYNAYLENMYGGSVSQSQLDQIFETVEEMFAEEFGQDLCGDLDDFRAYLALPQTKEETKRYWLAQVQSGSGSGDSGTEEGEESGDDGDALAERARGRRHLAQRAHRRHLAQRRGRRHLAQRRGRRH